MEPRDPKTNETVEEPKRPYHAPQLRRLGSVRDLTLGSPLVSVSDTKGGKKFM